MQATHRQLVIMIVSLLMAIPAQAGQPGSLEGRVLERGTRRPLPQLTVYIKETGSQATTDSDGRFRLPKLAPGAYTVTIPTPSFELYTTSIEIEPGQRREVTCYLEPRSHEGLEVVVRGRTERTEASHKQVPIAEATLIPGTGGDAVRVVENMPGVARGISFFGVPIRGSPAEDSRILLDGHEIPLLFHFGGFKSVYNSELISELNLYTGGFGPQFGNATGGIVELKTRDPRTDRWGGYVDTSFVDASALAEGPIAEDMGVAAAFRRSTFDLILPLVLGDSDDIDFTTMPVYYDYQAKWNMRASERHTLRLDAYGDYDALAFITEKVDDSDPEFSGAFSLDMMFHAVFPTHIYKGDRISSTLSPGYAYVVNEMHYGKRFYRMAEHHAVLREDMRIRLTEGTTLLLGGRLRISRVSLKTDIPRPPKEGDVDWNSATMQNHQTDMTAGDIYGGLYLAGELELGALTLVPGVRLEMSHDLERVAPGPSLQVRWQVAEQLALKSAVGLYHRIPDGDERIEPYGNDGLDFERAAHVAGGLNWQLTDSIDVELQAYYKYLTNLVSAVRDPSNPDVYENGAKGNTYGGEVLIRHHWSDRLFGWISYSLSRSSRNDGPGTPFRLFDHDQTHNLIVVGSWEFIRGWRLGGRFQYVSGEPYTEISTSIFDGDSGTYMPLYDKKNNRRSPAFHQFDVRLDKRWTLDTWILQAYLDVQNVYYHANPIDTVYNYDFSETGYTKSFPIVPSVGVKGVF